MFSGQEGRASIAERDAIHAALLLFASKTERNDLDVRAKCNMSRVWRWAAI